MKPEELLQMLRDGGMDDAGIAELLESAKGMLDIPAPEAEGEAKPAPEEDEDAKMNRVFGL